MADYIVLFGPPGVGKGTQASLLVDSLKLPHVATGDLFRDHMKRHTSLGKLAQTYMDAGNLVPDEVTINMLRERLEQPDAADGALLDGYPRSEAQADALVEMLAEKGKQIGVVLYLSAPTDVLLARLTARWTCSQCGEIYNLNAQRPRQDGVCDRCGGELVQRPDDRPEVQSKRIQVYIDETVPLIDYFRGRDLLVEIDGVRSVEEVHKDVFDAIERSQRQETQAE